MNKRVPYDFIKEKLGQIPAPPTDDLWNQMQQQLDKQIPQDNGRRRSIFAWFFGGSIIIVIGTIIFSIYHAHKMDRAATKSQQSQSITINNQEQEKNKKQNEEVKNLSTQKETIPVADAPGTSAAVINKTKHSKNQQLSNEVSGEIKPELKTATKETNNVGKSKKQRRQTYVTSSDEMPVALENVVSNNYSKKQKLKDNTAVRSRSNNISSVKKFGKPLPNEILVGTAALQATNLNSIGIKENSGELQNNEIALVDFRTKQILSNQLHPAAYNGIDSVKEKHLLFAVTHPMHRPQTRGWVAGAAINLHLPVSGQEMSTVNMNGKQNSLFDFLPSIYVQYHFNQKWYLSSELQWINPQYTPDVRLSDQYKPVNSTKYNEYEVDLKKLYYMNIPVSVHYSPMPDFYIGVGIQYSYLKRSVLLSDECLWEKQGNDWVEMQDIKTVAVRSNPHAEAAKHANNGNGNNGNPGVGTATSPAMAAVDSAAQSFQSHDWRWLIDVNYHYHRFIAGLSFTRGLTPYYKVQSGAYTAAINDHNESFQLYLRYNFLDRRR